MIRTVHAVLSEADFIKKLKHMLARAAHENPHALQRADKQRIRADR